MADKTICPHCRAIESLDLPSDADPSKWYFGRCGLCDRGYYSNARGESVKDWPSEPHPDDIAVDRFAAEMKQKLAQKRAEGRSGWDDPDTCTLSFLEDCLRDHVGKGDPVDVANFAMMIWNRLRMCDHEIGRWVDGSGKCHNCGAQADG